MGYISFLQLFLYFSSLLYLITSCDSTAFFTSTVVTIKTEETKRSATQSLSLIFLLPFILTVFKHTAQHGWSMLWKEQQMIDEVIHSMISPSKEVSDGLKSD